VVDDDPSVRRALSRWLRPELDLYVAASVREATELLATLNGVDLALVDLNLPDGSGEQVLQLIARWPDAISVLMSGSLRASGPFESSAAPGEVPLANRALVHLMLAKPIDAHVIEALKKAVLALAKD
jgi:CheY-like chemotaxis protein